MNVITKEELLSKSTHRLTMADLRKFVYDNPQILDTAPVMCERIEDSYFNPREWAGGKSEGWRVLLEEGEHYTSMRKLNENMDEEIIRREKGEEQQYPRIENPEEHKVELTDELKEQYFESWCISKSKDNSIVYVCNHY